jgi:sugar lactone lactonase YvrE
VGTPVAVDGTHVYWYDDGGNAVMQADADGSNPTQVATGQTQVGSIAVHSGFLYWTTQNALRELDLSGGSPSSLATGQTSPRSVAVDATHVYWATGSWGANESVQRIPKGGGTIDPLTTPGAYGSFAITLDSNYLYAADNHGGIIWRIPKAGGTVQLLAVTQPNTYPFDIAVDNVAVYWSSEIDATLAKVPK